MDLTQIGSDARHEPEEKQAGTTPCPTTSHVYSMNRRKLVDNSCLAAQDQSTRDGGARRVEGFASQNFHVACYPCGGFLFAKKSLVRMEKSKVTRNFSAHQP